MSCYIFIDIMYFERCLAMLRDEIWPVISILANINDLTAMQDSVAPHFLLFFVNCWKLTFLRDGRIVTVGMRGQPYITMCDFSSGAGQWSRSTVLSLLLWKDLNGEYEKLCFQSCKISLWNHLMWFCCGLKSWWPMLVSISICSYAVLLA